MAAQKSVLPSDVLFESYLRAPALAVPTMLIFIIALVSIVGVWYLSLNGFLPLWQGAIANGLLTYWMFSIIHDSLHHAFSGNKLVNEGLGSIAIFFLAPYGPMVAFRWVHNQHHIYANGPLDPDKYTHKAKWWQVPFKWTCYDGYYIYYFFKYGMKVAKRYAKALVVFYTLLIAGFITVLYFGYGFELLMLWFIPSRIALFLIAVVFVILPHSPGVVGQEQDKYMATTMRMGWEWLLTPLMVYQNYHLIHHLYPEIPFYKMHKAWYLKYDEINAQNVSFQTAFGVTPANVEAHNNFDHAAHPVKPA